MIGEGGDEAAAVGCGAGFFEVVFVIAGVGREAAGIDVEDRGGEGADEMDVVADKNKRAFVGLQGGDEGVDAGHVEVRGGFVEEEKVRRAEEQFDEGEAAFFAATEDADIFEDRFAAKKERTKDGPDGLLAHAAGAVHCFLEHRPANVEGVGAMLGKVADADIVPLGARACFQWEEAGEDFEEGRFARSVGSDEDGALSSLDGQVEVLVDNVVAVCLARMFEDHGALSAPGWLGKAEFDGRFRVFRRGEALDAGQLFDAFLGLGGFARFGAEAVDEILKVLDFALLVFVSGEVLLVAGLFLNEVVVVVAAVAVEVLT